MEKVRALFDAFAKVEANDDSAMTADHWGLPAHFVETGVKAAKAAFTTEEVEEMQNIFFGSADFDAFAYRVTEDMPHVFQ